MLDYMISGKATLCYRIAYRD